MLAEKRAVSRLGKEILRTPLLVPSFSSKGFPDVSEIIRTAEQLVDGPILISAYDLYHKKIQPPSISPAWYS